LLLGSGDAAGELAVAWEQTIMGAAQDAAQGRPWPREGGAASSSVGSWRTQGRRIELAAEILGVTGLQQQSPLVGPFGVSALGHREAMTAFGEATGYRSRGAAVCLVIRELEVASRPQLDLILSAGVAAGRWGQPWRWDEDSRHCRSVVARARSP
jgi:hypothetical protein